MPSIGNLAQQMLDLPRWVEVRSALLAGAGELFGLKKSPTLSFVLREAGTAFVVGQPESSAILKAIGHGKVREVIVPPEQADWLREVLPGWTASRILLYQMPDDTHLPTLSTGQVDFLDLSTLYRWSIPSDLFKELQLVAQSFPVAATVVLGEPVSFCYAGSVTESWWDISIDTLPEHRCKGYAALCVTYMIRHWQTQGKQPIWASVTENPASWQLAQKLGFVPADELILFKQKQ